ncbi:MAG: TonB-dependent receptor [Steroidobacteraceae bacterium]
MRRFESSTYEVHRTALAIAITTALAAPTAAWAQQASTNLEEVIVSGIRAGIEEAIETKRESGSIVEAVSAEDIGKLPDTSIAESISRLPGLTSQRAEGRASAISLRGTDPGFTTALMNGREQVSTGDNRSVEFDQYPSELLNSVLVYKTPDAQIIGQGLAGTIDLRTVRPLDYGRRAVVLNMRGEMNSNDDIGADSDDQGYRASFSYIDQFRGGTVGLAIGYAHLDSPLATRGFGTYEPWNPSGGGGAIDCGGVTGGCQNNPGVAPGNYTTNGMKVRADMGSTVRDGVMAVLQVEASDGYSTILDLYYSTMDQTNNARSLEVNLGGYPGPCCDGAGNAGDFAPGTVFGYSGTTIEDNTVVAGTLNSVVPLARNFLFETEDEIFAAGWRNDFALSDTWSLMADVSYSKATRKQDQFEINSQYEPLPSTSPAPRNIYDSGTFELRSGDMSSLTFDLDYSDPTQVQVGPTIYGAGYTKAPEVEDELTSYRFDLTRSAGFGWIGRTTFGVNYGKRTKDKISPEAGLGTIGGGYYQVESQYLLDPMDLGYADAGEALAWDVMDVLDAYYNPVVYGDPNTLPYLAPKYWDVEEKVWTGMLRNELYHEISDTVTLRGNFGTQVIHTDQSSSSFLAAYAFTPDQVVLRVSDGKTYTDVLPQVNLAFVLEDSQAIRVGIAKEMARARMDQLKATEESGYNSATGIPGGSGGNPNLDPWRAWAFDLSYERYFGDNKGYVSVAGFYKDLDSYIYTQVDPDHDFSELLAATPPSYFAPGVVPQATGSFSLPVNGSGGYLYGFELAASVPFDLFAEGLDGLGAIVSYSYTKSDIEIAGSISSVASTSIPLPGLSQDVWNATLYYEKHGFGARVATRYRSEYIGEVTNFANDRALRYVDSDMITDLQVSYLFSQGMMDGLQLLFQVNNVTNEPYVAYSESKSRLLDYQDYGTQYLLGVNYKF